MSHDASTRHSLLDYLENSPSASKPTSDAVAGVENSNFSADFYADRLMDELFDDVERMIGNGGKRTTEPVQPESSAVLSPEPPQPFFQPIGRSQPEVLANLVQYQPQAEDQLTATPVVAEIVPLRKQEKREKRSGKRSYDGLLLFASCASVIAALAVWLVSQEIQRQPVAAPVPPQATSSQVASNATDKTDEQFATYMQRSLEAIAQKTQPNSTVAMAPGNPVPGSALPNSALPTVTVPGTPAPPPPTPATANTPAGVARSPSKGFERIYVPVYQLPQALLSSKLIPPGLRVAPLPNVKLQAPQASQSVAARSTSAPSAPAVPAVVRTLVGVMELGDRSAALIEVNGIAQRFRVGESIGSSGWALVEVSKDQAIIRRNGEVRSVFIGQSF